MLNYSALTRYHTLVVYGLTDI